MQQRIPIYVEPRYLARYYHRDVCLKWRLSCSLWAHSAHLLISGQCSISIPPENVRKPEIDFDQAFVSLVREVFRTLSNIYNQGVIQEFILASVDPSVWQSDNDSYSCGMWGMLCERPHQKPKLLERLIHLEPCTIGSSNSSRTLCYWIF